MRIICCAGGGNLILDAGEKVYARRDWDGEPAYCAVLYRLGSDSFEATTLLKSNVMSEGIRTLLCQGPSNCRVGMALA